MNALDNLDGLFAAGMKHFMALFRKVETRIIVHNICLNR